jgi:hypothetical protein
MSFITGTQAELLYSMPVTGQSITGTVSAGSTSQLLTPVGGASTPAYQLPAYFFPPTYGTGKSLLVQGGGTLLTGPATQNLSFVLGADTTIGTLGITLCRTGLFTPFGSTVTQTGAFTFEVLLTCTAVGTTTTLNTIGILNTGVANNPTTTQATTGLSMMMQSATQPSINNATAYFIEMFAYWGATTTTQAVTLTNMTVWGLN